MPAARPMYWARIRVGLTPRITCAARSRCRMHSRSSGAIAKAAPGGHRLLAEPVVEGAGDLALAVEAHRALLDAPHQEHRAEQPDAVAQLQVLVLADGCIGRGRRRRVSGHLGCFPSSRGRRGISVRSRSRRDVRDLRPAAGSGRRSYPTARLPSVAWTAPGSLVCAGAAAAPGCGRRSSSLTVLDGVIVHARPMAGDGQSLVGGIVIAMVFNVIAIAARCPGRSARCVRRRRTRHAPGRGARLRRHRCESRLDHRC